MRALLLSAGVLLALAAGSAPARAATAAAAGGKIIAFADTNQIPGTPQLNSQLASLKQLYCTAAGEHAGSASLSAALAAARRLVAADSHGRGMALFSASPAGHSEARAIAAAAGALGEGKPAAALAALLRAQQLAPRDPVPLIDAAPLLSQAGKGNEALALLAAAQRLRLPKSYPFGIGWGPIIDADRGQALLASHQYARAESALGGALRAAPLLTEADQNMAVALDCQDKQDRAKRFLVAGVHRQQFPPQDYVDQTPYDPFGQLDPAEVLDTSRGQTLTLENLKFPQSLQEGHAMYLPIEQISNSIPSQQTAAYQQQSADQTRLNSVLAHKNFATQQRTRAIELAVTDALSEPDIKALSDKAVAIQSEIGQLQAQTEGQAGCVDGGASWGHWLSLLNAWDAAQRNVATALYRRQTALAANLKDPVAHQLALDSAHIGAVENFGVLVNGGWIVASGYAFICYGQDTPQENPESGQRQEPPSAPCPSGLIGPDISINLLVFSFSVNCEEVTIEAELGEGWLNGFVSGSHNFKKGTNTVYVGAQAGAKVQVGPLSGGATARGGVYVTFGADGSMQDVGLRGGTSSSLTIGPGTATISGPETSISFVGAST